ncbi:hypothetical protein [Vibrio nigripulchritudo]|uniref:hypothetical protein n=1 Tax=Vibrio nigripulchritudo TaxID=28173 RepID=UPI0005F9FADA|nr:hypothetical protein [Vibrio nigripulchritudo]KJY79652.1 hypothetical protein TW74_09450 [Vibrio nigripulchritudo]
MSQSIYIRLAFWLVKSELKREEKTWKREVRKEYFSIPWQNPHMLKDIGFESDGRTVGHDEPPKVIAERRIRILKKLAETGETQK